MMRFIFSEKPIQIALTAVFKMLGGTELSKFGISQETSYILRRIFHHYSLTY